MEANNTTEDCQFGNQSPSDVITDFLMLGLFLSLLVIVGILANACNIVVFAHKKMRHLSIHIFFISLSAADVGVLTCSWFMCSLASFVGLIVGHNDRALSIVVNIQRWVYPFAMICQSMSVWLTVSVALFRYVGICMPLYGQRYCHFHNAQRIIITVTIAAVMYNFTRFFEITTIPFSCSDNGTIRTFDIIVQTPFRVQKIYSAIYLSVLYNILMFVGPFILLLFVNLQAIMAVRRSFAIRRLQNKSSKPPTETSAIRATPVKAMSKLNSKAQLNTTIMLIAIVFLFLACNLPAFAVNVLEHAWGADNSKLHSPQMLLFIDFSNLFVALNSSANIIIYLSLSKQYRQLLLYIVFRIGPPPKGWIALGYLPIPIVAKNKNPAMVTIHSTCPKSPPKQKNSSEISLSE